MQKEYRDKLNILGKVAVMIREKIGLGQKEMAKLIEEPYLNYQNFEYGKVNNAIMFYKVLLVAIKNNIDTDQFLINFLLGE